MTLMTLGVQMTVEEVMVEDNLIEITEGMEMLVAEEIEEGIIIHIKTLVIGDVMDQIPVTGATEEEGGDTTLLNWLGIVLSPTSLKLVEHWQELREEKQT